MSLPSDAGECATVKLAIQENVDLAPLLTLRTPALARYYLYAQCLEDIKGGLEFARAHSLQVLLLGGGSNLILVEDFDGLVLHLGLKGVSYTPQPDGSCLVQAAAGENWHQLVVDTVARGYRGLENLALIPGTVGAAPVQNIGAYGVELKDSLACVEVLDTRNLQCLTLTNEECKFAYRSSLFKTSGGQHYVILAAQFRLDRSRPLQIGYGDLGRLLESRGVALTETAVMNAVMDIRRSKLPDPDHIPNVGSFFTNPIIDCQQFERLRAQYPNVAHYPLADGRYKVAAGWLIDQAGWKGYREGSVGVHDRQALVLVNPGQGRGREVIALARKIQADIRQRFQIDLEIEPVRVPAD